MEVVNELQPVEQPQVSVLDFERMAENITKKGGDVWLDSQPTSMSFDGRQVVSVRVTRKDEEITVPCAGVISTIPLHNLICLQIFLPFLFLLLNLNEGQLHDGSQISTSYL